MDNKYIQNCIQTSETASHLLTPPPHPPRILYTGNREILQPCLAGEGRGRASRINKQANVILQYQGNVILPLNILFYISRLAICLTVRLSQVGTIRKVSTIYVTINLCRHPTMSQPVAATQ